MMIDLVGHLRRAVHSTLGHRCLGDGRGKMGEWGKKQACALTESNWGIPPSFRLHPTRSGRLGRRHTLA